MGKNGIFRQRKFFRECGETVDPGFHLIQKMFRSLGILEDMFNMV